MKGPSERGTFGAWLVEQRKRLSQERGQPMRQQDVVAELRGQGFPLDDSYYRALEGGSKKPGREVRERLSAYFGEAAPEPGAQHSDIDSLVAAVRRQTEAAEDLSMAIRLLALALAGGEREGWPEWARILEGKVDTILSAGFLEETLSAARGTTAPQAHGAESPRGPSSRSGTFRRAPSTASRRRAPSPSRWPMSR